MAFVKLWVVALLIGYFSCETLWSQMNVTTLGIELKPLFSSSFVGAGAVESQVGKIRSVMTPESGMNFGMVVRHGISRSWSIESGICWVRRNFMWQTFNGELENPLSARFRMICYEIPFQALVFVKLGERLFMNGSGGVSIDLYPSDVESFVSTHIDSVFFDVQHRTFRTRWLQTALLVNYGFEYRSVRNGYFYLGASYHRGFNEIATSLIRYERAGDPEQLILPMSGNYLTLDFRYFFDERPRKGSSKK
jgi:hypothetical protein